ncbi:MAG: insulinase family protein, partial [Faecalibacterium sp.]
MDQYPGYTLLHTEACPEQHGTVTVLTHDVSGASVLLVENDDNNKAFGIGFGTFPSDDTGVFHILEHSVLSGSEKYPVKSPFVQLLKSSMASFLNAMTFPDKTVYPFATPNETDFFNLMDVYLNAVFRPLAMTDRSVFEQEGWHREADGTISGVVYNEMQGALASQDAQLQYALNRAMFPDTSRGFSSGGDPECIPALTYEKYVRVYRRHYRPDNCCITLYGDLDMARALDFLDREYLSGMPKGAPRPRPSMQQPQTGAFVSAPYVTEKPDPQQTQCALAWYTGDFADRERQLGVELLVDALLGTNQSPLKAALLEQKLGADVDVSFDDSTYQPTLVLVLRGATEESARRFAQGVRQAVEQVLAQEIPQELLLASLNAAEFASLERPGSLPDGVLDAVGACAGWLNADDPTLLLHTNALFDALRAKLGTDWFDALLKELFSEEPVQVLQVQTLPAPKEESSVS